MATILLTGATGQVGSQLLKTLAPLGKVVAPDRTEMNLADEGSVRRTIRELQPRWIVNPASYTAVDKAESVPEQAYAINEDAVRVIGEEAQKIGAGVISFSTDYVFDGTGTTPFVEEDPPGPLSVYGASKLAGERALAMTGAGYLVFRTSWVYGATCKNFLLTILKLARERETLRIVADQHGAPTWSRDLARMTAHVIEQIEASVQGRGLSAALSEVAGVYHAPGAGETTWFGFASAAVEIARHREPGVRFAKLEGIPTAEYPTPAHRPANSRMSAKKLEKVFGWRMMDWHDSLASVMAELAPVAEELASR